MEGSKTNIPASYLSGKLAAKRAIKAGVSSAVLDIGRITPTSGNRAFAVLKGLVDGGLDVPHSERFISWRWANKWKSYF